MVPVNGSSLTIFPSACSLFSFLFLFPPRSVHLPNPHQNKHTKSRHVCRLRTTTYNSLCMHEHRRAGQGTRRKERDKGMRGGGWFHGGLRESMEPFVCNMSLVSLGP